MQADHRSGLSARAEFITCKASRDQKAKRCKTCSSLLQNDHTTTGSKFAIFRSMGTELDEIE
jgi:hypothetical protein